MDCWIECASLHFKAQLSFSPFSSTNQHFDAVVKSQCLWWKVTEAALLNSLEAVWLFFPSVCGLQACEVHNLTLMTNNHPLQQPNAVSQWQAVLNESAVCASHHTVKRLEWFLSIFLLFLLEIFFFFFTFNSCSQWKLDWTFSSVSFLTSGADLAASDGLQCRKWNSEDAHYSGYSWCSGWKKKQQTIPMPSSVSCLGIFSWANLVSHKMFTQP